MSGAHNFSFFSSYPGHASREVILIVASLSTCDPSSIFGTFEVSFFYYLAVKFELVTLLCLTTLTCAHFLTTRIFQYLFQLLNRYHVRCSVISLSAEVFVFKRLCSTTSGAYFFSAKDSSCKIFF